MRSSSETQELSFSRFESASNDTIYLLGKHMVYGKLFCSESKKQGND